MISDAKMQLMRLLENMEEESGTMITDFTEIIDKETPDSLLPIEEKMMLEAIRSLASKNAAICVILKALVIAKV